MRKFIIPKLYTIFYTNQEGQSLKDHPTIYQDLLLLLLLLFDFHTVYNWNKSPIQNQVQ